MVVTPPAAAAWLAVFERLAVLVAGLAGEHLHVDQAGAEHVALAVDDRRRPSGALRRRCGAEIGDQRRP